MTTLISIFAGACISLFIAWWTLGFPGIGPKRIKIAYGWCFLCYSNPRRVGDRLAQITYINSSKEKIQIGEYGFITDDNKKIVLNTSPIEDVQRLLNGFLIDHKPVLGMEPNDSCIVVLSEKLYDDIEDMKVKYVYARDSLSKMYKIRINKCMRKL